MLQIITRRILGDQKILGVMRQSWKHLKEHALFIKNETVLNKQIYKNK